MATDLTEDQKLDLLLEEMTVRVSALVGKWTPTNGYIVTALDVELARDLYAALETRWRKSKR